MTKDKRYTAVKSLIDTSGITGFLAIFDYIPRKVFYQDMGINYSRFKRLLASPDLFTLRELTTLSTLFSIDLKKMIDLVISQLESNKRGKRKK